MLLRTTLKQINTLNNMNIQSIGENAGVIWRLLHGSNKRWEYQELKEAVAMPDRDLNAAIGWLAREGKIQFDETKVGRKQVLYIELNYYIG